MTKTLIALVAFSLVAAAPAAFAEEKPSEAYTDCEKDQPWIGYVTTNGTRDFYEETHDSTLADAGAPHLRTCEGEHWDGEDNVQPDDNPGYVGPCSRSDPIDQEDVAEAQAGRADLFAGNCMDRDPNAGQQDAASLRPLGFRVSLFKDGEVVETYVGLDIYGVGRAIVYAGSCQGTNESGAPGLEGGNCQAETEDGRQTRGAAYLQDNSNQVAGTEVLAFIVSSAGITKGFASSADCDQATYEKGAYQNDRTLCGRDNTAVTVEALLP